MDNFFDALKRFVEAHQYDIHKHALCFTWEDTKISYSVAEDIANVLAEHEINDEYNHGRIEELEDYNRLLRKENQELRDYKVEMEQNYEAAVAAMKGYSGEVE